MKDLTHTHQFNIILGELLSILNSPTIYIHGIKLWWAKIHSSLWQPNPYLISILDVATRIIKDKTQTANPKGCK